MKSFSAALRPVALFLLVFALYVPATRNEFIYDDVEVIRNHPAPSSLTDVARYFAERHFPNLPYYRPLTRSTLLIQKALHGENPGPFHVFNAALMGLAAVLAYAMFRTAALGIASGPALLAAAVFAVHPVASSCVYPISSGRETLMPTVWILAAVCAHLRGGRVWRLVAMACFTVALFCRELAVIVPGLFVLADAAHLTPDAPRRDLRGWIVRYLPVVPILGLYFAIRAQLFAGSEFVPGHLTGPLWAATYALQVIFAPTFALVYEPPLRVWLSAPRLIWTSVALLAVAASVVRLGPVFRARALFWLGWFVLALAPTSNLLAQEAGYDERYAFPASLAIYGLAASWASAHWSRPRTRYAIAAAGCLIAVACAGVSLRRSTYFRDDLAFHRQWHRTNPDSINANLHLGGHAIEQRDYASAELHFKKVLEQTAEADALLGLGMIRKLAGDAEGAIDFFTRGLQIAPQSGKGHMALAATLSDLRRDEEAISHFKDAILSFQSASRHRSSLAEAHYDLGVLLRRQGRQAEAEAQYRQALLIRPDYPEARFNLGNILDGQGRVEEALHEYAEVVRLKPDLPAARVQLGRVLSRLGRFDEAADQLELALRLQPSHPTARALLVEVRQHGSRQP